MADNTRRAIDETAEVIREHTELIQKASAMEREIESYYHRQEKNIRSRVALLDELETIIADERKCLEVQHEECRQQISQARRTQQLLRSEQQKSAQVFSRPHATLDRDEADVDKKLAEVTGMIASEDARLSDLLDAKSALEREEADLEAREQRKYQQDQDLSRALREITNLRSEITQRKQSLEAKNITIAEWNATLESREREIAKQQGELREDLLQLERQEPLYGLSVSSSSAVAPVVSQRQLMDDNDMSIEKENDQEEIIREDY